MLTPDGRTTLVLSAHADDLLRAEAAGVVRYLDAAAAVDDSVTVTEVAAQLARTRPLRGRRAVLRAGDTAELRTALEALADGEEHPLLARGDGTAPVRIAFVFPGQGGQWPGMGADLAEVAAYGDEATRCDLAFRGVPGYGDRPGPLEYLTRPADGGDGPDDPVTLQAAQFTHAVALAATWRECGVLPDLTVGHSLGELAAACVAGGVRLHDAAAVVVSRAVLTAELSAAGRYGMAALGAGPDDAAGLIAGLELEIAAVNGPASTVVSGQRDAVRAVLRRAADAGTFARELSVAYPGHTGALDPLRHRLAAAIADAVPDAAFHAAPVEVISSTLGGPIPVGAAFAEHWSANLRRPVRFDLAAVAALSRGATDFVEMSAHPTLVHALTDTVAGAARVFGSGLRDDPDGRLAHLSAGIASVAAADPARRWPGFLPTRGRSLRGFPHAPMRARRLWVGQPDDLPDERPVGLVEHWQPIEPPVRSRSGAVAIIDLGDGNRDTLTEALTRTLRCTEPSEAETLILIAPTRTVSNLPAAIDEFTRLAATHAGITPGPRCRRVWLLTTGGERIGAETYRGVGAAASAALAALHRAAGFDHPDQTFAHLDLPATPTGADLRVAVAALTANETEIAVRAGRLHARRLRRCTAEPPRPHDRPALRQITGRVVISGGTGAIGLAYAQYCATHGATDIVLLSRSGADDPDGAAARRISEIRRRTGVAITTTRCDVTDPGSVDCAAAAHRSTPADLVIHTASSEAVPGQRICAETVENAFGAKVIGLDNLVRYWPLTPAGRILVCSSVLALWGGAGHGLYAAANRMAEALTAGLRHRGRRAIAIRWGLWSTVGVVTGVERDRIARTGLTFMDPQEAIGTGFAAEGAAPDTEPAVLAADWDRLSTFFESQGVPPPFDHAATSTLATARAGNGPAPVVVAAELAAVLGVSEDSAGIDMHRRLMDLGLDSLLALDLRNRLSRSTGRRVAPATLLSGITGSELAGLLEPPGETTATEVRLGGRTRGGEGPRP